MASRIGILRRKVALGQYELTDHAKQGMEQDGFTIGDVKAGATSVGVCSRCGERYYPGPVLERLDEIAAHGMNGGRRVSVPTFDLATAK